MRGSKYTLTRLNSDVRAIFDLFSFFCHVFDFLGCMARTITLFICYFGASLRGGLTLIVFLRWACSAITI